MPQPEGGRPGVFALGELLILGDAFGKLRKLPSGQIPQTSPKLRPPGIQVVIDGVEGAATESHSVTTMQPKALTPATVRME